MADQPLSSLTLYKGTSTVDPGKQVAGVTDLASAAAWLMSPGNLASDTEYLAVLGSGLDLSSGFIMGGLPFLYNNITVTIQGDSSVQTIKMKTKSSLEVQSGVTIRLGNNIRLRGYNQTDDGENNGYPLVVVNGGAVEMLAGSEISGNVHERSGGDAYGGGVRLMGGGFAMKGGTIRDNGIIVDGGKPATGRGSWWTTEPSAWRGTRRWIPATKCACG
jgi:hypothetical protein